MAETIQHCPYCGRDDTVDFNHFNGVLQCDSCGAVIGAKLGRYRKLPVIVQAYKSDREFPIRTLEGVMTCCVGDWVIKGMNGECYPCKPDIFEKTYEPVELFGLHKEDNAQTDVSL